MKPTVHIKSKKDGNNICGDFGIFSSKKIEVVDCEKCLEILNSGKETG